MEARVTRDSGPPRGKLFRCGPRRLECGASFAFILQLLLPLLVKFYKISFKTAL